MRFASRRTSAHGICQMSFLYPAHGYDPATSDRLQIHVADRVANELQIPVYLYNLSARDSSRKLLADVRKGEYEGLENKLKTTEGKPDLGQAHSMQNQSHHYGGKKNIDCL